MRVVNITTDKTWTHYIGRPALFGNPFVIGPDTSRSTVIRLYERYARSKPSLLQLISALPEDAVLGCFCYPLDCHGDVIIKLWMEIKQGIEGKD